MARFGTEKYAGSAISNLYAHLTNTSINKNSGTYKTDKDVIGSGSKWDFNTFAEWLDEHSAHSNLHFSDVWKSITDIVLLTMLSLVTNKDSDEKGGCFELFGFDILLDTQLKPWLIEVNCAPSMGVSCPADTKVKSALINDMIDVLQHLPSPKLEPRNRCMYPPEVKDSTKSHDFAKAEFSSGGNQNQGHVSESTKMPLQKRDAKNAHVLVTGIGGFDLVFPFNETTRALSSRLANSVKKPGADIAPITRLIVQAIKRRKQLRGKEQKLHSADRDRPENRQ